jgi:hypothetical protein
MSDADGTYGFVYSGAVGVGVGVFTIQNSFLTGADFSGGRYKGTVGEHPNGQGYSVIFDMFVPAGTFLVQGGAPQEMPYTRGEIAFHLPLDFSNGEPIKRVVAPGNITFMIHRITDDWAWCASGVKVTLERAPESPM